MPRGRASRADRARGTGVAVPGFACVVALALGATLGPGAARGQTALELSEIRDMVVTPDPRTFMRTVRPQPAPAPLDAPSLEDLRRAQMARRQGDFPAARQALEELLRRHPHHPSIIAELVETHYGGHDWAGLERLCRAERLTLRDSLFLALPLVQALTYQGRHREAAQAAVEAVVASPTAAGWAATELRNLSLANPAGVRLARDGLRVAWMRSPEREDLLRLLAQLEWYSGHTDHALVLLETPLRLRTAGAHLLTQFADQLLSSGSARDSLGAARALAIVARHPEVPEAQRLAAAQRAFTIRSARGEAGDAAAELTRALRDVPPTRWGGPFALGAARALREGGHPAEARALLERLTLDPDQAPAYLLLERALAELRDGPPEAALPLLARLAASPDGQHEARFYLAEALFFAGRADTAAAVYENLAREAPEGPHADAALDRVYLIEDARPKGALALYARADYERWRGEKRPAETLADSLFRSLAPGALWARSALLLSEAREALGQYREALAPLAALADTMPADRLAPLARKRRGDLFRLRLKDNARALEEYEECLARYPRAWLAPEVRRMVEVLRRARTF